MLRVSAVLAVLVTLLSKQTRAQDTITASTLEAVQRVIDEDIERAATIEWGPTLTDQEYNEAGQTPEDDTNYESVVEGSNPNGQDMIGNIPEMPEISAEDRNAYKFTHKWQKQIPYKIAKSFSDGERTTIAKAFKHFHDHTCLRFVEQTNQKDFLEIFEGSGCYSNVGRIGGGQQLSLGTGCKHAGIVMHEVMHALGFMHEQSRTDRDSYVKILYQNIQGGKEGNFKMYSSMEVNLLHAPYDTCSIMHYGTHAFSKGLGIAPTIEVIHEANCEIGLREHFSDMDLKRINTLYECTDYPQTTGKQKKVGCGPNSFGRHEKNSCCTSTNRCGEAEGDCDEDSDCQPGLICGTQNCPKFSAFSANDDCCHVPGEFYEVGCNGGDSCCSSTNKCGEREGDCDNNVDCQPGLICKSFGCDGSSFDWDDDCCVRKDDSLWGKIKTLF